MNPKLSNALKVAIYVFLYVLLTNLIVIKGLPSTTQLYEAVIAAALTSVTYYGTAQGYPTGVVSVVDRNTAKDWKDWVHKFLTGRTHDTYALILLSLIILIRLIFDFNHIAVIWQVSAIMDIISLIAVVGTLVDLISHLWIH
ncbi:MAG: hypothetical protein QW203_04615 [Thermoplasmatales archaeon]